MKVKHVNKRSNVGATMQLEQPEDETIVRVREAIEPIADEIDEDLESVRSVLVIAARAIDGENGDMEAVQSYITMSGDIGLVQEALYAEMMDQIQNGNTELFQAIREVIQNIEAETGIQPEDTLDQPQVLH